MRMFCSRTAPRPHLVPGAISKKRTNAATLPGARAPAADKPPWSFPGLHVAWDMDARALASLACAHEKAARFVYNQTSPLTRHRAMTTVRYRRHRAQLCSQNMTCQRCANRRFADTFLWKHTWGAKQCEMCVALRYGANQATRHAREALAAAIA